MMNLQRAALCLIFIAPVDGLLAQSRSEPPREPALVETISVTGTGRVRSKPDRVMFSVGVETMQPTVEAAVQENNTRVAAVIAALKSAGARDSEIRTSGFYLNPQQQYVEGKRPRIVGFQANNTITLTRDKTDDVGKFLQAAVNAGANNVTGVSFMVSDPARGRDEGLKSAFDDARAKAQILARAAGRSVGRALSVTEGSAAVQYRPYAKGEAMNMQVRESAVSDVPIEQGTEELRFTVSVIFELR